LGCKIPLLPHRDGDGSIQMERDRQYVLPGALHVIDHFTWA